MTPADILTEAFTRVSETVRRAVDGMDMDQLTHRVRDGANTLAWLAWHIARGQDFQVAALAGSPEVWTDQGWSGRFALPFDDEASGYGQSSSEVSEVRVDSELLLGYLDAVTARTLAYLDGLTEDELDRVVDKNWNPPVTVGVRLVSVLDDCVQHAGQAGYLRGLI